MEKRTRFLISQAFLFLCICGGIGHIIKMTMTYFEYKTITRITLDKRQLIDAPTLVACVRYLEVMDFWSLGKKMGISYDANQSHDQIELLFAGQIRDAILHLLFHDAPQEIPVLDR